MTSADYRDELLNNLQTVRFDAVFLVTNVVILKEVLHVQEYLLLLNDLVGIKTKLEEHSESDPTSLPPHSSIQPSYCRFTRCLPLHVGCCNPDPPAHWPSFAAGRTARPVRSAV